MISDKLAKAREFEAQYQTYADEERPMFHVTGNIGWINDPNGFSVYKDEYHLFYQYYPYDVVWGPMHWGHIKTKDFIKWERLPAALAPDTEADRNGCFSGTALEMPDGRQLLMYTGVYNVRRTDGIKEQFQHQCIAIGDGVNYEKYADNPVIDASFLPDDASPLDFRDPKIWYEADEKKYYCIAGNRAADGSGSILLFESEDALHWKYVHVLEACYNDYGRMWECPDLFPLDNKHIMIVSPQEMKPMGLEFHAGYGVVALLGSFDKQTKTFDRQHVQAVDYGIDFYAPQTLLTPDGRRVMIAWMQNWTSSGCKKEHCRIFGSMTLPRELSIKDGRLIQTPVRELNHYRGRRVFYENVLINREVNLNGVRGRHLDMTVDVRPVDENSSYDWFKLNLAKDGEHSAVIRFKPSTNTVRIDRTKCGSTFDIVHVRDFLVKPQNGKIRFRIVMDGNSVELFVNDGEQAATFLIYDDDPKADCISFESEGGSVFLDIEKYDINLEN